MRDFLLYIIDYEMYERRTFQKMTELWISNVLFNVIYFETQKWQTLLILSQEEINTLSDITDYYIDCVFRNAVSEFRHF